MIIGIDMGGTNIDGVAMQDGKRVKTVKRPVDRNNYFSSVWSCVEELLRNLDRREITRIHLSTTISTNAIVEKNTARVGLIIQEGPGLRWPYAEWCEQIASLSGSVDHRGKVVREIDADQLTAIKKQFVDNEVEALAIVSKFSPRNPDVELTVADTFSDTYDDITMGHSLSGKLNFPRRVQTAYLNAAVGRTFRGFAEHMRAALKREKVSAPVYILKADGGTMTLEGATSMPVETILSGPAASLMGMRALFPEENNDRVLLDIGGTTTDVFFMAQGVPVFEPAGIEIDGRKTLVRAIFSTSIGLGGDSHVRMENGELRIGPRRLDNAVAFGGKFVTPTDALVYLGRMEGEREEASRKALEEMAKKAGMESMALAESIVQTFCTSIRDTIDATLDRLNASPVYTIRELLEGRTLRPVKADIIGGPAKGLRPDLEKTLEMPVRLPEAFDVANAIGAALAKPTLEINLHADTERGIMSVPELEIYENINRRFDLDQAQDFALKSVRDAGRKLGLSGDLLDPEIVEASSFNMVQGYSCVDKNIRVRAQIRPGLLMVPDHEREV